MRSGSVWDRVTISTPGVHGADELVKALKWGMAFKQLLDEDPQEIQSV